MKIAELMTRAPRSCRETDTLDRAAQLMWEFDCGFVPVVNQKDELVGTVTDRDICMAAWTQGRPVHQLSVSLVAKRPVFTVHEGDTVEAAELLMLRKQIRRLPVLSLEGKMVGVVSISDLARRMDPPASGKGGAVSRESVAQTLAGICRPHADTPPTVQMTPPPPPAHPARRRASAIP